ncbi:glycerate kinase family protein [Treponema phagedenis]|uniref:glycerate kinase family protein n=1 Tax=Treponema phagedenis TaxID=162 RepID=UPI0001F63963|nr:glycerate kinase [Treponema phagedenis]EFW36435.1 glycerate kinase [Treponema phagedenis F0421]TYT76631.1 glycerate kinase [Treponema phagedenis]
MKTFILAPDSFKGTMSAIRVCEILKERILAYFPNANIIEIPIADGGEGSADAFLRALGGKKIRRTATGPLFEKNEARYAVLPDNTAVIEMAAASGLPLVGEAKDPKRTTTYGTGELLADAVQSGCKNIILALGGSATNDGGCGLAAAMGVRFYDKSGKSFVPVGGTLSAIKKIDTAELDTLLPNIRITAICDVDNPLFGARGAAAVFAPQKGASEADVRFLDEQLQALYAIVKTEWQRAGKTLLPAETAGFGAAGGLGFGMSAFFSCELKSGIQTVLDVVHFDALLSNADLIFTGEGCLDSQSLHGKVVYGVTARAARHRVPVIAIAGDILEGIAPLYEQGLTAAFSTNRRAVPYEKARLTAEQDLRATADNILRLLVKK